MPTPSTELRPPPPPQKKKKEKKNDVWALGCGTASLSVSNKQATQFSDPLPADMPV